MSRGWCTNSSFMVLMSLVNSPIARILRSGNTKSGASSRLSSCHVRLLVRRANPRARDGVPGKPENLVRNSEAVPRLNRDGTSVARLTISTLRTYVRHMTGTENEGESLACQGLHN